MERERTFNIDNHKRHVSKIHQNPPKSIFLSPVYVKRSDPSGEENMPRNLYHKYQEKITNRESCTQTSKTIIQLAKLENGYMSPDSLNPSPHSDYRTEKKYCQKIGENRENKNLYNEVNYFWNHYDDSKGMREKRVDKKSEINYNPLRSNPVKSLVHIKRRIHSFSQKTGDSEVIQSTVVQEKCIGDQINDDSYLWEEEKTLQTNVKSQKHFEVWHAQVFNDKFNENPTPNAPIVVNIIDNKSDKFSKESSSSLIKEFLTSKDSKPNPIPDKPMKNNELPLQRIQSKPITLRSQSYVERNSVRKLPEIPKIQTNKVAKVRNQKLAQFYKICENKLKEIRETEIDEPSTRPHAFTRRSNSFMSPTLSSEKKSVKQAVDNLKNLNIDLIKKNFRRPPSPVNLPTMPEEHYKKCTKTIKSEILTSQNKEEEGIPKLNNSDSATSIPDSVISNDSRLQDSLGHIKSPDWNSALNGLAEIIELARSRDPSTIIPFMTMINQRLLELMRSPRSHVCRTACQLAGHLFETMRDTRRPVRKAGGKLVLEKDAIFLTLEFDDIVTLLLNKTADASKFIREDANVALDSMVTHIPTFHTIRAICTKGPTHRNPLVRCAAIRLFICAVVIAGPDLILTNSSHEHSRRRIIVNLSNFLEDKNYDTRKYAERLYKILSKHKNFQFILKKYLDKKKVDSLIKSQKLVDKYVT